MNPATGVLTINLAAIEENWRRVNQQLQGSTRASAVIKANAYGLGAERIGPCLYEIGCREFFVATQEEALAARQYLPSDATIYVLGGVRPGAEHIFIQHQLIPVLFSLAAITRWREACTLQNLSGRCVLKVDTGMTRLGLSVAEFSVLCMHKANFEYLDVVLVMSHLACADEPEHSLNQYQLAIFERLITLARQYLPNTRFSLANSAGVFLGNAWHFDLVRPGAALYGINSQPKCNSKVIPVIHLALPVLQVRTIEQTVRLGYGATATLSVPARVIVVAGGYADGLNRIIGSSGLGEFGGHRLPVIGRISMDTTIFDASVLGDLPIADDALLEVCNNQLTVDYWAAKNDVIGYEVLTSLGQRYQRHYVHAVALAVAADSELDTNLPATSEQLHSGGAGQ